MQLKWGLTQLKTSEVSEVHDWKNMNLYIKNIKKHEHYITNISAIKVWIRMKFQI